MYGTDLFQSYLFLAVVMVFLYLRHTFHVCSHDSGGRASPIYYNIPLQSARHNVLGENLDPQMAPECIAIDVIVV